MTTILVRKLLLVSRPPKIICREPGSATTHIDYFAWDEMRNQAWNFVRRFYENGGEYIRFITNADITPAFTLYYTALWSAYLNRRTVTISERSGFGIVLPQSFKTLSFTGIAMVNAHSRNQIPKYSLGGDGGLPTYSRGFSDG
ncbi:MAG: hypothetical protein ABSA77_02740 [Thermoguttaceae bacterium]|jgi:hypothetical protein